MYPEKIFPPDSFRLWVNSLQKVSPASGNVPRKDVQARPPPALGRSSAKSHSSLWKCTPKRRSGQTTSGCLSTPIARLPKWPVAITRKSTAPDRLRFLVNPFRKISPAARCDNPKKCSSRQLSAFGQFSAKSLASVRKCTPKRRPGQTTSGCLFPPIARLPKWPVAITRKSTAPDSLRLWIYTEQKASPAFGDLPRKNVHARQLSAFGQSFSKNLSSGPLRRPEKVQLQTAFGFWSILSEKPLQPSEIYPEKTFMPDCL